MCTGWRYCFSKPIYFVLIEWKYPPCTHIIIKWKSLRYKKRLILQNALPRHLCPTEYVMISDDAASVCLCSRIFILHIREATPRVTVILLPPTHFRCASQTIALVVDSFPKGRPSRRLRKSDMSQICILIVNGGKWDKNVYSLLNFNARRVWIVVRLTYKPRNYNKI